MIDKNSSLPLYRQISDSLMEDIANGTYKIGEKLPGEMELCKIYNVSRITLRHAIANLTDEGILVSKQGKGTYVAITKDSSHNSWSKQFQVESLFRLPSSKNMILSKGYKTPGDEILSFIGETDWEPKPFVSRLRYSNDAPAIIETDYFEPAADAVTQFDLVNRSLLRILKEELGINITTMHDYFGVCIADEYMASVLKVPVGTPLTRVVEQLFDKEGKMVFLSDQVIRNDVYRYNLNYKRASGN